MPQSEAIRLDKLRASVMAEIGLGVDAASFEHALGCRLVRRRAVEQLPAAVAVAARNQSIVAFHEPMLPMLRAIAAYGDERDDSLKNTWQACNSVVRAHIEAYTLVDAAPFLEIATKELAAKVPDLPPTANAVPGISYLA